MIDIKAIAEAAKRDASREAEIRVALQALQEENLGFKVECTLTTAASNSYKAAYEVEAYIGLIWPEIREDLRTRLQEELAALEERYRAFEKFLTVDQGVDA